MREVARILQVRPQSIYNWIARLGPAQHVPQATGTEVATWLADAPRSGRPPVWTEAHDACLRHVLASTPETWGYAANDWTVPLLHAHVQQVLGAGFTEETLRRA